MAGWERQPNSIASIALTQQGKPWTRGAFSTAWERERNSNPNLVDHKERGRVAHGLRAAACVRLTRAGATTRQIADMVA